MSAYPTLVFGGNGRLAAELRRFLPENSRYAARAGATPQTLSVGDYTAVSAALFQGSGTVINCAGITAGEPAALRHANVDVPVYLATRAREAGVRRYVQVSSFSVLGRGRRLGAHTAPAPVSEYGRSKLAAEKALLALATPDFAVVPVRLPAIVGGGARDKLRQLVAFWLKLRRLPVPRTPVRRAMISTRLAAQVLAAVADGHERGVLHAADPEPFSYGAAATAITAATGRRVGLLLLPDIVLTPLEHVVPELFASLYAASTLDLAANVARSLPSNLYQTIAEMAQQELSA